MANSNAARKRQAGSRLLISNVSYDMKMSSAPRSLTSAQIRAARALLRWSAEDLANETAVGVATIRRAELSELETSMTAANNSAVRRALESAGIEFIDRERWRPRCAIAQASTVQAAQIAAASEGRSWQEDNEDGWTKVWLAFAGAIALLGIVGQPKGDTWYPLVFPLIVRRYRGKNTHALCYPCSPLAQVAHNDRDS